jgi:hypothetical protein
MNWLSSEDLKEEKVVTAPWVIVSVLIVENNAEKRTMDFKLAVVANEAQLSEPVHEEANPRASCAYHLS